MGGRAGDSSPLGGGVVIRRLFTLAVIGILVWLLLIVAPEGGPSPEAQSTALLGFALLAAALMGEIVERVRLPRITGYILAGVLFGPDLAHFLTERTQGSLTVFNELAYAFIGLAAGAELKLAVLRGRYRSIVLLIVVTTLVVMVGVGIAFFATVSLTGFLGSLTRVQVLAVAALVGVVAAARSPSSAIAIIDETGAKGPFSETILGVSVAMDVVVITLFSIALALAGLAFAPEAGLDFLFIFMLTGELAASVVGGIVLGWLMTLYLKHEGPQLPLVIAGLCFIVYRGSMILGGYLERAHELDIHLEPLLLCATAGFVIQNLSRRGARLDEAMDRVALPVYVLFFTLAGARLDLRIVMASGSVALAVVVFRLIMLVVGTRAATRLAGDPPSYRRYCWLGFVTQAGLSFALIGQIDTTYPEWGTRLANILIAVITINQLVGPAAFKIALERVGEARASRRSRCD